MIFVYLFKVSLKEGPKYSREQALKRVKQCFPGSDCVSQFSESYISFKEDSDGYSIFEITKVVTNLHEILASVGPGVHLDQNVREEYCRFRHEWGRYKTTLINECKEAITTSKEIDHGTGFIFKGHWIVTCKHVIQDHIDHKWISIVISNSATGGEELVCELVDADPNTDLALLHCKELNSNIQCLPLSTVEEDRENTFQGMQICCLGYPPTNPARDAYLLTGILSGWLKPYGDNRYSMMVLGCNTYPGFSGGPVIAQIDNDFKVVGVLLQKQVKSIFTMDQLCEINNIKEKVESGRPSEGEKKMFHFFCMLSAAYTENCQTGFSHALQGSVVGTFVNNSINKRASQVTCSCTFQTGRDLNSIKQTVSKFLQ